MLYLDEIKQGDKLVIRCNSMHINELGEAEILRVKEKIFELDLDIVAVPDSVVNLTIGVENNKEE